MTTLKAETLRALAEKRVRKYLTERQLMRGLDFEQIHGLHTGTDRECELLASDLLALLEADKDERVAALEAENSPMTDPRIQQLTAIMAAYLPPDGISKDDFINRVIEVLDPGETTNPETAGVEPVAWLGPIPCNGAKPEWVPADAIVMVAFNPIASQNAMTWEFAAKRKAPASLRDWEFATAFCIQTSLAHPAPASNTTSEGEVDAELIARVEHVANATGKDRWKVANLTGYDWRRILAAIRSGSA